jgi:Tetraacyldisaccharide-1-P 4''-kinase
MQFKKPKFWDKNRQTIFSLILFPLSIIVNFVAKLKRLKKGKKFKIPIICIGNIYLGGTGKTPISIEIFKILSSINKKPVFIKKFYPYIHDEINILNGFGSV